MSTKAYFSDIPAVILDVLPRAEHEIFMAVAKFTNREIFDCLCKQAALKVEVSVALVDSETNQAPFGLNLQRLTNLGGRVVFIPPDSRDELLMHDNFCIIDERTVITGAYNWGSKASADHEHIIVITDAPEAASRYRDIFHALENHCRSGARPGADSSAVRRRLELIRNLILLGKSAAIAAHLQKLRPLAVAMNLAPTGRTETVFLKLQLSAIELRLEALSNEKAEFERRLEVFNRSYAEALGDLIQQVLKARAQLAQSRAAALSEEEDAPARVEAEAQAEEADTQYREYAQEQHALSENPPPPVLDPASERELKRLYRKACSLCHPDKVVADQKARANEIFQELQAAYRRNDLQRVREIYEALKTGAPLAPHSALLNEVDTLKAAIAQMESAIVVLLRDLQVLRDSEAVRLMESIDDFAAHVHRQRRALEAELERLEQQLQPDREHPQ